MDVDEQTWNVATKHIPIQDDVAKMKATRFRQGDMPPVLSISFCTNLYLANMVAKPRKDTPYMYENNRQNVLGLPLCTVHVQAKTYWDLIWLWNAGKSWITPPLGFHFSRCSLGFAFVWSWVFPAVTHWGEMLSFFQKEKWNCCNEAVSWEFYCYFIKSLEESTKNLKIYEMCLYTYIYYTRFFQMAWLR